MAKLALVWCFWSLVSASSFTNMEQRFWDHELKKTYCQLIQRQQIYQQEELQTYCAGKVAFFDTMVSNTHS